MRAGRLNDLITIQRKTVSSSDSGEQMETWSSIAERRMADVFPLRGEERFGGEQLVARQQTEFRIRLSQDVAAVSPLDRIVYPALTSSSPPDEGAVYDVLSTDPVDDGKSLRIIAARRADAA